MILENNSQDYIDGFELKLGTRGTQEIETIMTEPGHEFPDGRIPTVARLAKKFLDWIETGKPQSPDLKAGCRVDQFIQMARSANETRTWARF